MSEGRVAQVVCQTSRGHDGLDVGLALFQFWIFFCKLFHRSAGDGTAYTGHFEAVGLAVVNHLCAWKGKYLGFVLQSTEGTAENDTVVVALKRAPDVGALVRLRVTFVG